MRRLASQPRYFLLLGWCSLQALQAVTCQDNHGPAPSTPSPRNAYTTTIEVYDATPTPVQIVASDNTTWFNVHLYVLVDTGDASEVAQGGAFWRWGNTGDWQAAPVPLYDEHQIDPVVRNSTRRGYNIAWGQSQIGPTAGSMQFRVWAIGPHDVAPVETVVSKPAVVVTLPPAPASNLSLSLFKAVAFSGGADDGVHAHLVINAWPPQSPVPPDYQLFAEVLIQLQHGEKQWIEAGAPSRFEHTYDQAAESEIGTARTVSRYNLSWRLSPAEDGGRAMNACSPLQPAQVLDFRVRAVSYTGLTTGSLPLLVPAVPIVCVD